MDGVEYGRDELFGQAVFRPFADHFSQQAVPTGSLHDGDVVLFLILTDLAADFLAGLQHVQQILVQDIDLGTQLVILVENLDGVRCLADLEEWVEPDKSFDKRNRSGRAVRYTGRSIAKACRTMHDAYGVMFGFCAPEESGARIIAILDGLGG